MRGRLLLRSTLLTFLLAHMLSCTQTLFPGWEQEGASSKTEAMPILENLGSDVDRDGLSNIQAVIQTRHGSISYRFYPQQAPKTVVRVIELIERGFYNGLSFHRVIPKFIIQGGDPTNTGMGGSGTTIPFEFNDLQHLRGSVAMARGEKENSADSQFYIALSSFPHLDGKFTIFGKVVAGFDILDKIKKGDKMITVTIKR